MKERGTFPTLFWILAGALAIGWALLLAGSREVGTFPSADSFGPSGTAALAELLRREGFAVRVDRSSPPSLRPGDVAVCAFVPRREVDDGPLLRHLEGGGRILALPLPRNFDTASRAALDATVRLEADGRRPITVTSAPDLFEVIPASLWSDSTDWVPLWTSRDGEDVAALSREQRGVVAVLNNGLPATNRFLDRQHNAALLLDALTVLAGPNRSVVFVEASFGNARERGLLATLGPWAAAAGAQAGLLLLVIAFTLGRRFGLPERSRTPQRGARDLVDAIGQVYDRARATPIALAALAEQADHVVRTELKLPRDATPAERDRHLPEELGAALRELEAAGTERIPRSEALRLARRLDEALERVFGSRVSQRPAPTPGSQRGAV